MNIDNAAALVGFANDLADRSKPAANRLRLGRYVIAQAEDALRDVVAEARADGATWQQIGDMLGVTRQAAQMRFGK